MRVSHDAVAGYAVSARISKETEIWQARVDCWLIGQAEIVMEFEAANGHCGPPAVAQ
jgi:hypothetical protein